MKALCIKDIVYESPLYKRQCIRKPFMKKALYTEALWQKANSIKKTKTPSAVAIRAIMLSLLDKMRVTLDKGEIGDIGIKYLIKKPGIEQLIHKALD